MPHRNPSRAGTFQARSAPGRLAFVQAFVNTRDPEADTDQLDSPEALAEWLVDQSWAEADIAIDEDIWKQAIELREILRDQFRLHTGVPGSQEGDPTKRLSRLLGVAQVQISLRTNGQVRLGTSEAGWPGFLARLLLVITEAVRSKEWSRLKACHEDTCQWIFYDSARNRTGKWCSVRRCGNRVNRTIYFRRRPRWQRG